MEDTDRGNEHHYLELDDDIADMDGGGHLHVRWVYDPDTGRSGYLLASR